MIEVKMRKIKNARGKNVQKLRLLLLMIES